MNKDKVYYKLDQIYSCLKLLGDHFDCPRDNTNLAVDHYNITRYFDEYNALLSIIMEKTDEVIKLIDEEVEII